MGSDVRSAAFDLLFENRVNRAVERLSEAAARCLAAAAEVPHEVARWDAVADEASSEVERLLAEDRAALGVLGLG